MLDSDRYDVIVLGTGLAESIAAAALAKAGKSVLHLDPNEYYGGEQASLTLDELVAWADARSANSSSDSDSSSSWAATPYGSSQRAQYSQLSTTGLGSLASDRRRYALSLFPSLMVSRGELVSTLISSDVSKYVGFRLLDSVNVWDDETGSARRVPGSKEDVFRDKSISLPEKRKLMKALLFAGSEFEEDELLKDAEGKDLLQFLQDTFALPSHLAQAVAYAVAFASPEEKAVPALERARRYLRSIGRYGPSAFLIGQYGGAGEVAQGYCRACAVFGGTYVLGPEAMPEVSPAAKDQEDGSKVEVKIPAHPTPLYAKHVITSPAFLPAKASGSGSPTTMAHAVAVVTSRPACLKPPAPSNEDEEVDEDDTAVVIFPPTEGVPLVRAMIHGEGTGSCPSGQWIVYLSAAGVEQGSDPEALLRPYLDKIGGDLAFQAYYLAQRCGGDGEVEAPDGIVLVQPYAGEHMLTEGLDWEAAQGEKAFRAVAPDAEFFPKPEGEDDEDEE